MRLATLSCAFVLLAAAASSLARGEINGADSIEWMVADADLVVRGTVSEIRREPSEAGFALNWGTIEVQEVIKGTPPTPLEVLLTDVRSDERAVMRGEDALFFLVRTERLKYPLRVLEGKRFALREAESAVLPLEGPRVRAFTMDFRVLKRGAFVRGAAHAAAMFPAGNGVKSTRLEPPVGSAIWGALYAGSAVFLTVPVDGRLEALARGWTVTGPADQGVLALRHFPSDQNEDVLKALLRVRRPFNSSTGNGPLAVRWDHAGCLAYETLRSWGRGVSRPILVEPDDWYGPARGAAALLVVAVVVVACAAIVPLLRRRARPTHQRLVGAMTAMGCALALLFAALWVRSVFRIDDLFRDGKDDQLHVASYRGQLQVTLMLRWPGRIGFRDAWTAFLTDDSWPRVKPQTVSPRGWVFASVARGRFDNLWSQAPWPTAQEWKCTGASYLTGQQQYLNTSLPFHRVRLHFAWLIALSALIPVTRMTLWAGHVIRASRRRSVGLCPACGYDVRATPDRCPECGIPLAVSPPQPAGV